MCASGPLRAFCALVGLCGILHRLNQSNVLVVKLDAASSLLTVVLHRVLPKELSPASRRRVLRDLENFTRERLDLGRDTDRVFLNEPFVRMRLRARRIVIFNVRFTDILFYVLSRLLLRSTNATPSGIP